MIFQKKETNDRVFGYLGVLLLGALFLGSVGLVLYGGWHLLLWAIEEVARVIKRA